MAPQKRTAQESECVLDGVSAVLTDIEGTTTPISFVKDKLFPYILENVETFLSNHYEEEECQCDITALIDQAAKDKEDNVEGLVEIADSDSDKDAIVKSLVANVTWQMSSNRKAGALKELQGHIWREAYKQGKVKGDLFYDVMPMVRQLVDDEIKVYVYSSGSVDAQRLLFSHTEHGDITELFSGFFDTAMGGKRDADSYKKITAEIGLEADEILFLTDIPEEASAAVAAGMRANLVVRPGNADLTDEDKRNFATIESFEELFDVNEDIAKKLATEDNGNNDEDDDDSEGIGSDDDQVENIDEEDEETNE